MTITNRRQEGDILQRVDRHNWQWGPPGSISNVTRDVGLNCLPMGETKHDRAAAKRGGKREYEW